MTETPTPEGGIGPSCEALLGEVPGATRLDRRPDGLWMAAPDLDVLAMARLMRRLGARLSAITGVALANGETGILYHYCVGDLTINIKAETQGRTIPSITPITRAADWGEREISDLYGTCFSEHPNPARLIRPPALAPGFFRDSASGGGRGNDLTKPPFDATDS